MKIKYKLNNLYKGIWHVEAKKFDLAMIFFHTQEYYENKKYKNKDVDLFELMRHYADDNDGVFSYADDYVGFNVSSDILNRFLGSRGSNCLDPYTETMVRINATILDKYHVDGVVNDSQKYYLIGTIAGDTDTFKHELAHAFYNLDNNYKKEVKKLVKSLPKFTVKRMYKLLGEYQYHKSVFDDEINAYCIGSAPSDIEKALKKHRKAFRLLFNRFRKNIKQ